MWRAGRDHAWASHRNGTADLVAVSLHGGRAVARTGSHELVELPRTDRTAPARLRDAGNDVIAHCVIDRGVVALHPALHVPDEGGPGPHDRAARVTLTGPNTTTVLDDGATGEPSSIACDGDVAWILVTTAAGASVERR